MKQQILADTDILWQINPREISVISPTSVPTVNEKRGEPVLIVIIWTVYPKVFAIHLQSGFLFTKGTGVLPQDFVKSRSRENRV